MRYEYSENILGQSETENNANEKTLSLALSETLKSESVECISELAEVGLDSILEEGLFKELPIISTAVAIYKIGGSIKDRHNLKKLMVFLNEINNGIVDEQKRQDYQQKFQSNDRFRNQEIEYLLVLIDRYISYDKPQMLAKLYLAYLEGAIVWDELSMYAEVIDRFFVLDFNMLISNAEEIIVHRNIGGESVLRLVALGLMTEVIDTSTWIEEENGSYSMTWATLEKAQTLDKTYKRTEFGEKLAQILR